MLALLSARCGVINAEIRQTAMTRPGAKPGPSPGRRAELKNVIEPPNRRFEGILPTNIPLLSEVERNGVGEGKAGDADFDDNIALANQLARQPRIDLIEPLKRRLLANIF